MICFGAILICAQDTVTGAFQGTVSNSQTGDPIPGAAVEIVNQQTGLRYNLTTDYRGLFYQGQLRPGPYKIKVSITGYQTHEHFQYLRINFAGEVVPVPVALDPAASVAPGATTPAPLTVEDTDTAASINRTDARRTGSYPEIIITALPVGSTTTTRTFDQLALLLPGVAPPPQTLGSVAGPGVGAGVGSAGQFSSNGLRSRGNNFTVDGSDNNDEDIGVRRQGFVALVPQPLESIQEYQVITLLAPAQFGRNIGAQVNAVSKSGGSEIHGTLYGMFNSSQLNGRNFFDTTFGSGVSTLRANNQDVLVQTRAAGVVTSQQPLTVRNESGGKDSFTFWQGGFVIGGPIKKESVFYFASFEREVTNATEENNFAVPTVEQRGAFRTGATGIFQDPFTGLPTASVPASRNGSAIFSLYPFPNNPNGVYAANTFTQTLPASGRGTVLSGKIDYNFKIKGREQSTTGRYNFTDDWREIPVTGGALFSALKPRIRTQNFSFYLNSKISGPNSTISKFNQVRLSYGRTRLRFDEVRDTQFLIPSARFPTTPFLLNAVSLLNVTTPAVPGAPNSSPVVYVRQSITTEQELGPLGQVVVAGFSPIGVDVYNFPQQRINNTYQVADNLTWRTRNHSYTFGVDIRRSELNSDLPRNARPLVTFDGAPRLVFENGAFRFPISSDLNQFIRAEDLAAFGAASNFYLTLNTVGNDAKISLRFYQLNFFAQDEWRVKPRLSLSYGLRYEYNTPARELNGRIENTFSDPALDLAPGLRTFIEGRTRVYDPDRKNLAPRVGLAYSTSSRDHATVVRLGYGVFYDQILGAVVSQSRNVFPTFLTLNFGGLNAAANESVLTFFNPGRTVVSTVGGAFIPIALPGTLNQINPGLPLDRLFELVNRSFPSALSATLPSRHLEMPRAHHYSLAVEQQLGMNTVVSVAYVGTIGQHLLRFTTPNLGAASTLVPSSFSVFQEQFAIPEALGRVRPPSRPVSGVGAISRFETTANSRYDSLQVQVRGRLARSLQYQAAYTLSRATDDVSDVFDLAGAPALPQNSLTLAGERGPANFDARHRFSYNFIYEFPKLKGRSGALRFLSDGLQIASTARLSTGQPFTVNSIFDVNLDGNLTDRLSSTNGLVRTGDDRQPLRLTVDPARLLAPVGQDGTVGRNTFRAGRVFELDFTVIKNWAMSGGRTLSFRADMFNLPNRANFGIPNRFLEAPGFGQATSTVTPGRRVQFTLKYSL